ncbi:hypothetical protein JCM10213_007076 [Rhodosporidiobolus nylandii]
MREPRSAAARPSPRVTQDFSAASTLCPFPSAFKLPCGAPRLSYFALSPRFRSLCSDTADAGKASRVLDTVEHDGLFDRKLGINIIRSALTKPARTIAENAGEEGSVIVGTLLEKYGSDFNTGFNAATGEYVDMIKAGVLDPLKIVKGSLQNAAGVSSLLFTTEASVVDAPEEKGSAMPAMPGGGMGGMGF